MKRFDERVFKQFVKKEDKFYLKLEVSIKLELENHFKKMELDTILEKLVKYPSDENKGKLQELLTPSEKYLEEKINLNFPVNSFEDIKTKDLILGNPYIKECKIINEKQCELYVKYSDNINTSTRLNDLFINYDHFIEVKEENLDIINKLVYLYY